MLLRYGICMHQIRKVKPRGTSTKRYRVHFIYQLTEPDVVMLRFDELSVRHPGKFVLQRSFGRGWLATFADRPAIEQPQLRIYLNPSDAKKVYIETRPYTGVNPDHTVIDFSTRKLRRFIRRVAKLAEHA